MRVLGLKKVDYVSRKDGQRKQGITIFYANNNRTDVVGETCGEEYIGINYSAYSDASMLKVGDEFDFLLDFDTKRVVGIDIH